MFTEPIFTLFFASNCLNMFAMFAGNQKQTTLSLPLLTNVQLRSTFKNLSQDNLLTYSRSFPDLFSSGRFLFKQHLNAFSQKAELKP